MEGPQHPMDLGLEAFQEKVTLGNEGEPQQG